MIALSSVDCSHADVFARTARRWKRQRWWLLLLTLCVSGLLTIAPQARAVPPGCYISTGDHDWLWDWPPTQSRADIEAFFQSLRQAFGCGRIYWRGYQSALVVEQYQIRPENFLGAGFWQWERHLAKQVGTSRIAVETAHRLGMEIWGFSGLFEHGACADSDAAKGYGPSPIEDRLRIEHPEWIPVDRHGLRRQSGPLEFAYPEVRRLLVRRYANALDRGHYDGLMFYTYVEHFTLTFADEFGFSPPIVVEFKRRYGQDIRRETFDRQAWYRLRGEYVTEFLRELSVELKHRGKKLGVAIDPQQSHGTAPWLCDRAVHPAGPIYLDWQRWVRDALVDEIMVYCNGDQTATLHDALAATAGTACQVSAIHGTEFRPELRHFDHSGVRRVMVGSLHDFVAGHPDSRPAEALAQSDPLAKLRVLEDVIRGRVKIELPHLLQAAGDPHVLVRRQALAALAAVGSPEAVAVVQRGLDDPEHSVRCAAVEALSRVQGPESVGRLLAAVRAHGNFQFNMAVSTTLGRMNAERTAEILHGVGDADACVRRVATYALRSGPTRPEALPVLIGALGDSDAYVRFAAAVGLGRYPGRTEVVDALIKAIDDRDPTVRLRVVVTLAALVRSNSRWLGPTHWELYLRLCEQFTQCGQGNTTGDADWCYRPLGNALVALGPRAKETLQTLISQDQDSRLADRAWQVLYVPQTGYRYCTLTEAQAVANYQRHPRVSRPVKPLIPAEPSKMPYLVQSFNQQPAAVGPLGDPLDACGEWRAADGAAPMLQDKVRRGERGCAVRLHRGAPGVACALSGRRSDYSLQNEPARVEFWAYREGRSTSFAVLWRNTSSNVGHVGVYVKPDGRLAVMGKDQKWLDTDTRIASDCWQRIALDVEPAAGSYTVRTGAKLQVVARAGVAMTPGLTWNVLYAAPQPPEGGTVYLDDVLVSVPNPAHSR